MTNTQCYFGQSAKLQESVGLSSKTQTNDSLPGLVHKSSSRNKQCASKVSLCWDKSAFILQIQLKKIYALILNCRLSCVIGFRSVYFSPFCVCFWEKKNQAHLFLTGAVVSITLILSDQMFVKFCLQKALLSNTIRWSKKTNKHPKRVVFSWKKRFLGERSLCFYMTVGSTHLGEWKLQWEKGKSLPHLTDKHDNQNIQLLLRHQRKLAQFWTPFTWKKLA